MNSIWNFIGGCILVDFISDFIVGVKGVMKEPVSPEYKSKKRKAIGSIILISIILTLLTLIS